MKCIECKSYHPRKDGFGAGCDEDGDTTNPEEDIFCGAAGDRQEDYEPEK